MNTYRNKNFKSRNYDCTNIVACVAPTAPNDNWVLCDESYINNLTKLWAEGDVRYYGYL